MAAASEGAGLLDFATEAVGLLFQHPQLDEAVVDEDDSAYWHRRNHLRVVRGDDEGIPISLRFRGAGDVDQLARGQLGGFGAGTGPNFRTFDVHHDSQFLADLLADFTHAGDGGPNPSMVSVRHV